MEETSSYPPKAEFIAGISGAIIGVGFTEYEKLTFFNEHQATSTSGKVNIIKPEISPFRDLITTETTEGKTELHTSIAHVPIEYPNVQFAEIAGLGIAQALILGFGAALAVHQGRKVMRRH